MDDKLTPQPVFRQKKIGHIFHYTRTIESLVGIINNGFYPSYCRECIGELEYLIPMVSFCNISIKDVGQYMMYGDYGIGMSIEWAIRNKISPVIYVHENSPFSDLHSNVNKMLMTDILSKHVERVQQKIYDAVDKGEAPDSTIGNVEGKDADLLIKINNFTVPLLQFFKNWEVMYKDVKIVTYHEREWRYIPELDGKQRLVNSSDELFQKLIDEKPKQHLSEFSLEIETLYDLRYIIVKRADERQMILECLKNRFGDDKLIEVIVSGQLLILTDEQIKNDF